MWVFLVESWNFELFIMLITSYLYTYVNMAVPYHSLSWVGYKLSSLLSSNARKEYLNLTKPVLYSILTH